MKKLIIFYCGDGNSLINFRGELIKKFLQSGFSVVGVAPNIDINNLTLLDSWGASFEYVPIERKSINPFKAAISVVSLIKIIIKYRPSHIFSYTHKPVLIGAFAGKICGTKNIISLITGTGHLFDEDTFFHKLRKKIGLFFFKIALFFSTHIIFQNPDDKKLFIDLNLADNANSFQVNGSGVDLSKFRKSEFPKDLTFLCLARLIKSKGIVEYANVSKAFKRVYPNVRFLLGGPADKHNDSIDINEIQQDWYHSYGVEYIGNVVDVEAAIQKSSIYVLLSYNEGTPRSVLEAMSVGRPIITTDVSGCRETVHHGVNGYLVPAKDAEGALPFFLKIMNADLIRMGNESRKYCESKYDVQKVNKNIFEILEVNG